MKKRILFINGHLNAGGVERSLTDLLNVLDDSKYEVDLLLLEELGDYYEEIPQSVHVYLHSLNASFGRLDKVILRAIQKRDWFSLGFRFAYGFSALFGRRFLRLAAPLFRDLHARYDTIVAYRPGICTDIAAYALDAACKVSWWHHGEVRFSLQERQNLDDAYGRMNCIVSVSQPCSERLVEAFPDIREKLVTIPNMVDVLKIRTKAEMAAVVFSKETWNIVTVGRFSPEKNMPLCVLAADALNRMGIPIKWYLIGDGPEMKRIAALIREKGLEHLFILTGMLPNPYPYMLAADLYVHPSPVESQGLTMLEAMALNTPVAAVPSDGANTFLQDGVNGFLLDADPERMAEKIRMLFDHSERIRAAAQKACETVSTYSPERIGNRVEILTDGGNYGELRYETT